MFLGVLLSHQLARMLLLQHCVPGGVCVRACMCVCAKGEERGMYVWRGERMNDMVANH